MPMVVEHPGIPGAFQVIKLPSERDNSVSVGIALSKNFAKATDTITATVTLSAAVDVATAVSIAFDPSYGSQITAGTLTPSSGTVTNFSFPINIAKTGTGTFPVSVVVTISTDSIGEGTGSALFTILTSIPTTMGAPVTAGRIDANRISWTPVAGPFLSYYNVYRNITSNSSAGATFLGKTVDSVYVDQDVPHGTQPNYWYFVTEVDLAGNEGAKQSVGVLSTPVQVIDTNIQNAAVHLAKTDFGLILAGGNAFGVSGNNFIVPQLIAGDLAAASVTATKLGIVAVAYDTGQFTSNSPSGFVAWGSGLRLIRNGLSYPDGVPPASATTFFASGNTNKSVIWWKASAPTVIQADNRDTARPPSGSSFDGKFNPAAGDVVLGFNYSGTFTPQWSGTVVTGDQIKTGGITAAHIDVTDLSAITASLGLVYAGRIQDNAVEASSHRGIRVSSTFTDLDGGAHTYGIPTTWKDNTLGYYIDLAADPASSTESTFMKVGPFITIDLANGGTSRFHGSMYADTLVLPDLVSGATIGVLDSSGLRLDNPNMLVKAPGIIVQKNGTYATVGDRVSIGATFVGPSTEYAQSNAINVWNNTLGKPSVYAGSYTVDGSSGASDEPALATEFPTAAQSVSRTSSGVSTGTTLASIDLGTSAYAGPTDKRYTFTWTLTLAETSVVPATTCQADTTATAAYSTDSGSTWNTLSTRNIEHLITTTTTNSEVQSFNDVADFSASSNPAHLLFRVTFNLDVIHAFTGTITATVAATKVYFHNAGSGPTTIRNLRLNGASGNPHMTLEPVTVGGWAAGRKGDLMMGSDGFLYVYGSSWQSLAISSSLAWSSITGTPTTIGGYGITDLNSLGDARWLKLSGGTLTGGLTVSAGTTAVQALTATSVAVSGSGAVPLSGTNTGTGDVNLSLVRSGGTASSWSMYSPSGSTDLRFFASGADNLTLTAAGAGTFRAGISATTGTFNTSSAFALSTVGTTGRSTLHMTSTGGNFTVGVEASTGGGNFSGTTAYAATIGTNNSTDLYLATNGTIGMKMATDQAVTFFATTRINAGMTHTIAFAQMTGSDGTNGVISLNGDISLTGSAGIVGGGDSNLYIQSSSGSPGAGSIIFRWAGTAKAHITSSGLYETYGSGGGYLFADRTSGDNWFWYSDSGNAYLGTGAINTLSMQRATGNFTIALANFGADQHIIFGKSTNSTYSIITWNGVLHTGNSVGIFSAGGNIYYQVGGSTASHNFRYSDGSGSAPYAPLVGSDFILG